MYFITSTIKDWIQLLANNKLMAMVIQYLRFLIERIRILPHGYVLMPNHIHRINTVNQPFLLSDILQDLHKYTFQQMIKLLRNQNNNILELAGLGWGKKWKAWKMPYREVLGLVLENRIVK